MSKLVLFLFVFALFVCYVSAYAADPGVKLQADETVRVAREASALPDPGRYHNRGHGGYQYHYQPHYPSWNKYHNYGGWGGSRRKH